jgi:tRNA(adenine34) deaminase
MDFMNQAIILAQRAFAHDDVPIGAVIVRNGKIIARGENMVQKKQNPTLHAEIVAINRAVKKLGQKFLDDCDIYVSLEPCAMCATAISFARIKNIYFAATDEKGGGITANARVFDNDKHLWHPNIIQMPEYADKSAELLREFFKQRRKSKETQDAK